MRIQSSNSGHSKLQYQVHYNIKIKQHIAGLKRGETTTSNHKGVQPSSRHNKYSKYKLRNLKESLKWKDKPSFTYVLP